MVWTPDLSATEPHYTSLLHIDERVKAYKLKWRSNAWQQKNVPAVASWWMAGNRLYVEYGPVKLLELGAREAFFMLELNFLILLCALLGVPVVFKSCIVRVLFDLIIKILGRTAEEALRIIQLRLRGYDWAIFSAGELLMLDEALEAVDPRDRKVVLGNQEDLGRKAAAVKSFVDAYRRRVRDVRGGGKGGGKGAGAPAPRRKIPRVSQEEAKTYLPPGAHIWRGLTHWVWAGHMPPRRRISEPFNNDDCIALVRLLKRLWEQYLEMNALEWKDCPYDFVV